MQTKWMHDRTPELRRGVQAIIELPADALVESATKAMHARAGGTFFDYMAAEAVASRFDIPVERLVEALATIGSMVQSEIAGTDSLEAIASDLHENDEITDKDDLLRRVREAAEPIRNGLDAFLAVQNSLHGTFPLYQGVTTRNTKVYIVTPEFRPTENPEDYAPDHVSSVAVVVANLNISEYGQERRVRFAMTPNELDSLINHLQLARQQLRAVLKSESGDGE